MARCALDSSSLSSALATPRTLPPEAPPCHAREPATRHMSGSCGRYGARLGFMAGILHRCAQLPAAAGGGLAGAAALTKPQSRVRPMTLLFFRCKVLTRSLTRRRQDPGLDSARGMAHPRRRSKLLRPGGRYRRNTSIHPCCGRCAQRLDPFKTRGKLETTTALLPALGRTPRASPLGVTLGSRLLLRVFWGSMAADFV